ncbi:MAG TPA: FAD-binding oxidoreductase [Gaiellaceae bacterium]|nr:FAD-binding oxidoreductase [Gaiellaceae bacterium]
MTQLYAEVRAPENVLLPGEEGWDDARLAWNLAVDQRPEAVALPESAEEVANVVRWAAAEGYRVTAQSTGHNAASLGDLAGTVLVKLERLRGVTVDPEKRIARAPAGTIWIEVVEAAAEHGLAALAGSSPDVGVVGYALGGGLSFLARKHGLMTNHVTAIELVAADGELRRVDADNDPELFWALRGGGGSFGVVTAVEIELLELDSVHAGHLWFPVERAAEVLRAWRDWTETVPEEVTSIGRILQFPPIPEIPEPMRGNSFAVVQAIYCGDDGAEMDALLEPLRALGPAMDTFRPMSMVELSHLHMDPDHPVPGAGDGGMLDALTDETIDVFVREVVGKPILSTEIRHYGGAVARPRPEHGAVSVFAAPYIMFAVGIAPTAEAKAAVHATVASLMASLEPWQSGHTYLNFAESRRDSRTLWPELVHARLKRIKAEVDPADLFRSNHPL